MHDAEAEPAWRQPPGPTRPWRVPGVHVDAVGGSPGDRAGGALTRTSIPPGPEYILSLQATQRDGAARPAPGNGNKRQRPNPRPDLKRGREEGGSEASAGTRPSHTKLNMRNQRQI
eukprot:scaffold51448_cov64-Phaeocystis_antarctica.AAC.1